ncbi:MAG: PAS domain-containing protein, partial [Anaerolineae bacterium]|nr:PAS domain-containing protein [Anaerolineae bacterium]
MRRGRAPTSGRQRYGPTHRHAARKLPTLVLLALLPLATLAWRCPVQGRFSSAGGLPGMMPNAIQTPPRRALSPDLILLAGAAAAGILVGASAVSLRRRRRGGFLRTLIDAAPIGIAVVSGPENRVHAANPAYRRAISRPGEPLTGRPLRQVLPEEMARRTEQCIAEVYRTGRPSGMREVPLTGAPEAVVTYWDLDCIPLPGPPARTDAVLMLAMPVTEQVRARQEIEALARHAEQEAARLKAVLTAACDPVWLFDGEGRPVFANEAAWRFLGLSPATDTTRLAEVMPRVETFWPDGRRMAPEDRTYVRALRGERTVGKEILYRLLNGELRWGRVSAAPVRDPAGRITGAVLTGGDITAQKQSQAERERLLADVQAAHEKLRVILDRLPDGVLVVDEQLRIAVANSSARHCLGQELEGISLRELGQQYRLLTPRGEPMPPEERPVQRVRRGEPVAGLEMRVLMPDGRHADLLVGAAPLPGAEGRTAGTVVTLTDITALREAQEARERLLAQVQSARENLQTILDRLPDGVLVIDTGERVTTSNETVRRYVGYDVVGRTLPELRAEFAFVQRSGEPFPPGEAPVERALRGEAVFGADVRLQLPGGRHLEVLESIALLHGPDGGVTGAVVAFTDITALSEAQAERERLLSQLQAAEERMRTILARLPDGVLVFGPDMRVTLTNESLRAFLGYDLVGMTFHDLDRAFLALTPEGRPLPAEERPSWRVPAGQSVAGMEVEVVLPDGRRAQLLLNSAPLRDEKGDLTGAVMTVTDITPLREAREEREKLLAQVQAARENLRTILDQLPDGVLVFDPELRVTLSNETVRRYAS